MLAKVPQSGGTEWGQYLVEGHIQVIPNETRAVV